MKKFFGLVYLFLVLALGGFILNKAFVGKNASTSSTPLPVMGAEETSDNLINLSYQGKDYKVAYFMVEENWDINLLANFEEKLTAEQLKQNHNCDYLVNGGFYTTDGKPSGYFFSDDVVWAEFINNKLFDGILSLNDFVTPRISREVPQDHLVFGLQTGPVLKENASFLTLKLSNDKPARRVVAAITGENSLYFLAIYSPDQVYDGPYLVDVPEILSSFEKFMGIIFADAINLDGGSASAFYAPGIKLSELSPIGSAFCIIK